MGQRRVRPRVASVIGHSVFIDAQNQQQKLSIGGDKLQWAGIV
jgi:hypothetical protein